MSKMLNGTTDTGTTDGADKPTLIAERATTRRFPRPEGSEGTGQTT